MIKYNFTINSHPYQVEVNRLEGETAKVTVNGHLYEVKIEGGAAAGIKPLSKASPATASSAASPVVSTSPAAGTNQATTPAKDRSISQGETGVPAPLPGTITEVVVSQGQSIKKGERLLVLESMKIGNDITSPQDGTVKEILISKGDVVQEDQILVIID